MDAQLRVEIRERLVHEVGGGLANDRPAHGDSLALAPGERARLPLEELLEAEHVRGSANAPVDLVLRHLSQPQAECDVVVDSQVRIERVALEHHRDVAVSRGDVVDDPIPDADHAFTDAFEPGDHSQSSRLATSRRADEHHELSVADLETHARDGARAVGVDLADSLESHGCHQVSGGTL